MLNSPLYLKDQIDHQRPRVRPALFSSDFYRDKRWCFKSTDVSWMLWRILKYMSSLETWPSNAEHRTELISHCRLFMRGWLCMCPALDEHWLVLGPFLHELVGAHVCVQTFSTFVMTGCQRVMLFIQLLGCLLLVSLMTSHWLRLPDELRCCNMIVEHCFEQWVFYILSRPLLSVFL